MHGIKYYPPNDLACGWYLGKAKKLTDSFDIARETYSINEILEFFNIVKYIDGEFFLSNWNDKEKGNIKAVVVQYKVIAGRFFSTINDGNILPYYKEIFNDYLDDFWACLQYYNTYKKISVAKFEELLQYKPLEIRFILENKNIVEFYKHSIRNHMMSNSLCGEIIIDKYIVDKNPSRERDITFPSNLSIQDKEAIILDYINSDNCNLNNLYLIINHIDINELKISPKIKLAAKRKSIKEEKLFLEGSGFYYGANVSFVDNQETEVLIKLENSILEASYSRKWLKENNDFPTLLNNFIHLFGYVDKQMRINLVSKKTQLGLLESIMGTNSKKAYIKGIAFTHLDILSFAQLETYINELRGIGIDFKEIIEFFFKNYLLEEFNIEFYHINMPRNSSTYFEKCKLIFPEIDSILKQYKLYVENKEIDHELLQISSNPSQISEYKSLLKKKYVYVKGESICTINFLLFSNQASLSYIEKTKEKYGTFYDLLMHESIALNDFADFQEYKLNFLLVNNVLVESPSGKLLPKNLKQILILKDLYKNEVINYWHYSLEYQNEINDLLSREMLSSDNSLFSIPEQKYFNYYLNKSSFDNGPDIRNKYLHGTQPLVSEEEEHKRNYLVALRIMILMIIKINDDLCLFNDRTTI